MQLRVAAVLLTLAFGSGCLATSSNAVPSGGGLKVDYEVRDHPRYFDSGRGEWVPAGKYTLLHGFSDGGTELDDELDFYHVAGEAELERKIVDWRTKNNIAVLASWGGAAAGLALVGAGVGIFAATGSWEDDKLATFITTPLGQGTMGLMTAGGIVLGAAPMAWLFLGPKEDLHFEGDGDKSFELVHPLSTAIQTAEKYNLARGEVSSSSPAPAPTEP